MLMQPDANDTYNAKKPSRTYNRKEETNTEVSSEDAGCTYTHPYLDSPRIFLPASFHAPTTQSKESPGQNGKHRLMSNGS